MNSLHRLKAFAAAGALALLAACTPKVELMASMPEGEANEVLAALQNAGIRAEKLAGKEGNVGLSVEADAVGRAVDLLRAKGLPRERFAGMGQVFKKEGLISSPLEERARYLYALSQELSATISQIDGVIVARVHVVLPERGSAGDPNTPSSAAVFIKYQDGYNLDTVQPQIRRLVSNSIPSLAAEKISIVLVPSQQIAAAVKPMIAADGGVSTGLFVAIVVLLLASLGAAGFLAWKYWWPTRNGMAPAAGEA
jgi:type III secretion protein J